MSWAILAVAAVAFALALLPTRRLFVAGWRPAPLAVYLAILVGLAVAAVFVRTGIRFLVPILLVLYVLPFVGAPEVVARTVARIGGGRPPRVVEGRAVDVSPATDGRSAGPDADAPPADPGAAGGPQDGPQDGPHDEPPGRDPGAARG
jgi:hypothetical protein